MQRLTITLTDGAAETLRAVADGGSLGETVERLLWSSPEFRAEGKTPEPRTTHGGARRPANRRRRKR